MARSYKPGGPVHQLKVRLPQQLHGKLVAFAAADSISLNYEIVRRIEAALKAVELEATIERAVERALAKSTGSVPEPIGSPPPAYRQ